MAFGYIRGAVAVLLLVAGGSPVAAQSGAPEDDRLQAAVSVGVSRAWDDEGGLGTGVDVGGSAGWQASDHVLLSATVSRLAHERLTPFLSWDASVWTVGARAAYGPRSAAAKFWPFIGAGIGVMRSAGTITERRDDPFDEQPPEVVDIRPWTYTGPLWEVGVGAELRFGRAFVRPETWWTVGMLDRGDAVGVPEPPIILTRFVAVAAGVRF